MKQQVVHEPPSSRRGFFFVFPYFSWLDSVEPSPTPYKDKDGSVHALECRCQDIQKQNYVQKLKDCCTWAQ